MSSTPQESPEDQEANDLEVGDQVFPLDSLNDYGEHNQELELGDWGTELEPPIDSDDAEGPSEDTSGGFDLVSPISSDTDGTDEEDAGSFEDLVELEHPAQFILPDEDSDADADSVPYTQASDLEPVWSPQPWCEHRPASAFAPHTGLFGVGNIILATGDSTEVLRADSLEVVDSAPTSDVTFAAVALDESASRNLLTTATGQLLLWDRQSHSIQSRMTDGLDNVGRITCMCHGSPGSYDTWLLGDGSIYHRAPKLGTFGRLETNDTYLWIAPTNSGILGITRGYRLVALPAQSIACADQVLIPCMTNRSALAKSPILAIARTAILVGAREYGAWLSTDGGRSFQELAGCQNVTACTFGAYSGRACLWLALFYELEDRTDIVAVDCKSRRIGKLAKFSVVADSPGPDDDPPERARVDSLYWDGTHQRLWAAGCFGVTCFEPPQNLQPPC